MAERKEYDGDIEKNIVSLDKNVLTLKTNQDHMVEKVDGMNTLLEKINDAMNKRLGKLETWRAGLEGDQALAKRLKSQDKKIDDQSILIKSFTGSVRIFMFIFGIIVTILTVFSLVKDLV